MTTVKKIPTPAFVSGPPLGLPSFSSFAVSQLPEPVPGLMPAEQVLLSESAVPARRESFARGRAAAHAALSSLGLDRGPILTGPSREPLWPAGVTGSISHAEGIGVALVAPTVATDGIGVDVEELRRVPELREHVPRAEERAWIEDLDPAEQEAAILALFSAKESVFKAFFPRSRSFFGFESAVLTPAPSGFIGRLSDGVDGDYPSERTFVITCRWFAGLVLTAVVLPKTPGDETAAP